MSTEYFRFRHPVTTGDLFLKVDLGLSHTCRSNAWLSSELQNFSMPFYEGKTDFARSIFVLSIV